MRLGMGQGGSTAWSRARELAERTPASRNRYVDFLRAVSIGVVVLGHWLMAAPSLTDKQFTLGDMLVERWAQWLTWVFQVMPLFFIVGGYANAASWQAARRSGRSYGDWAAARVQRLIAPVIPLVLVWSALALLAPALETRAELLQVGSRVAFIPTWFLAVYVGVAILAPATLAAWRRFGAGSFWALAIGAAAVDAAAFAGGVEWVRWANYGFVWPAVHQLGYLWRDGRLSGPSRALPWAAGGLLALVALVTVAGYPVSMISVPGQEVSNSKPPTLALLALGAVQAGAVLSLEAPARRWLQREAPWAATVLVNGRIMTVYLWHATALIAVVAAAYALGGLGLRLVPGSAAWWAARPVWIGAALPLLALFVALFGRYERPDTGTRGPVPAWLGVASAGAACAGMASIALGGIASASGLRLGAIALVLAGALASRTPWRG
jgi:fucose 4-O-acetylase-like acetyltransferase